jgi:hypothetical protein
VEFDGGVVGYTTPMRIIGLIMSFARTVFGLALIAEPKLMERAWIGKQAGVPGAQLLARAVGARDLTLGAGGLQALVRDDGSARPWLAAAAVSDAVDFGATWAAGRTIPRQARNGVLGIAAVFSMLSLVAAAAAGRSMHTDSEPLDAADKAPQSVPSEPVGTA